MYIKGRKCSLSSKICRLHILAEDVALLHWTNINNGDLILTNYCEDQLVHKQNMLQHTMNANRIKDTIERANICLSSLTLTSTEEMDLLLNINALQPVKITAEATSSLANIGVLPDGKKVTYKITKDNMDMYLKELLKNFIIYNGKSLIKLEDLKENTGLSDIFIKPSFKIDVLIQLFDSVAWERVILFFKLKVDSSTCSVCDML